MAQYTVTDYRGNKRIFKRKDIAAHELRITAWNALHAFGLLDTKAGHAWYQSIQRVADDIASGTQLNFGSNFIPTTKFQIQANSIQQRWKTRKLK